MAGRLMFYNRFIVRKNIFCLKKEGEKDEKEDELNGRRRRKGVENRFFEVNEGFY
ncbi:MAG: hypothetical protein Q8P67_14755 [archaeon]|nr:hypothetical protein [archaeon]